MMQRMSIIKDRTGIQIGQKIAKNEKLSKIDKDFLNTFKQKVVKNESTIKNTKEITSKPIKPIKKSVDADTPMSSVNDTNSVTTRARNITNSSTNNVKKLTPIKKTEKVSGTKADLENKYIDEYKKLKKLHDSIEILIYKNLICELENFITS